jgi:hypothetical protein
MGMKADTNCQGNGQRGSAEQQIPSSMPPGYPGPPLEDARPRQNGGHRRQPSSGQSSGAPEAFGGHRRGGAGEQPTNGAGSSSAPNRRSRNSGADLQPPFSQQQQQRRQQPQSASLETPVGAGPSSQASRISRLESPSVIKSVLQPLERKISEYDQLMTDASTEMTLLDEEIRALQARRQLAEDRFLGAKAKHDDYERQRDDVEHAMRGEWPPMAAAGPADHRAVAFAPTPVMTPQQQPPPVTPRQAMAHINDDESVDERPLSRESEFSHSNRAGTRDRFRLSNLFRR